MHKQGKNSKNNASTLVDKAIDTFLKTNIQSAKFGRYVIDGDKLSYCQCVTSEIRVKEGAIDDLIGQVKEGNIGLVNCTIEKLKNLENAYIKIRHLQENVIAKRIIQDNKILYVGNSQVLRLIGRKTVFGNVKNNRYKTEIQEKLENRIPMLNFKFFDNDGCDLRAKVEGWKHISEQVPGYQKSNENKE